MNLNQFKLNLNKLSFKELQDIALSLGITKKRTNHCNYDQLYSQIEIVLESIQSLEIEQSINSFNKERPPLVINDSFELLFWKVFRSKYIFKTIFSNFNSEFYGYYQLVDIHDIMNRFRNGKAIIKDKLLSGSDSLVFSNNSRFIYMYYSSRRFDEIPVPKNQPCKFKVIYKLFNSNNRDNQKVFNQLFNNYSLYFSERNIGDHLLSILESFNLVALDQFTQFYSSNNENLEYIRKKINLYCCSFVNSDCSASDTYYLTLYSDLKKFNFLKSININHLQFINNSNQIIDKINSSKYNNTIKVNFSRLINASTTLKRLNKIFKMITNNNLNNINNRNNSKIIDEINHDINSHFNKSGLLNHSLESSVSITYNSNNQKILVHIIKIIGLLTSTLNSQDESTLVQLKDHLENVEKENQIRFENDESLYSIINQDIQSLINYSMQFTNNILEKITNKSKSNTFKMILFQWIRRNGGSGGNNLEALKQLHSNWENSKLIKIFKHYYIDFLLEVKSKEELDFYFTHYQDIFYLPDNSNWKFIKSIQLLEYYESQMKSLNRCMVISNLIDDDHSSQLLLFKLFLDLPLDRICRATFNPLIYKFQVGFKLSSYHGVILDYFNLGKSDIIIQLFKVLNVKKYQFPHLENLRPHYINSNFIKWIFENNNGDFEYQGLTVKLPSTSTSIEFEFNRWGDFVYLCYFNQTYQAIPQRDRIDIHFMFVQRNHLCFNYVEDLIQLYRTSMENTLDIKRCIIEFFNYASIFGLFYVFKLLLLRYSSIISRGGQFIQIEDLKVWLKLSIQCGHIKLADLLSSYCRLTEREFIKYIDPENHPIGYNHFKNKFIIKEEQE